MSSTRKNPIIKDCIEYMRQITEGTPGFSGAVTLPSGSKGGFVHYFQDGSTYSDYAKYNVNVKKVRDTIVELLECPSTISDLKQKEGYKIIEGGAVAQAMLDFLKIAVLTEEFASIAACQKWIADTYQIVINYIDASVKFYFNPMETNPLDTPRIIQELSLSDIIKNSLFPISLPPLDTALSSSFAMGSPHTQETPLGRGFRASSLEMPEDSKEPVSPTHVSRKISSPTSVVSTPDRVLSPPLDKTEKEKKDLPKYLLHQLSPSSAIPFPSLEDQPKLPVERRKKIHDFFKDSSYLMREKDLASLNKGYECLQKRLKKYIKEEQLSQGKADEITACALSFTRRQS